MSSYKTRIEEEQSGMFRKSPLSLVMRYSYTTQPVCNQHLPKDNFLCIFSVSEKKDLATVKKFLNMKNILVVF